MRKFTNLFLCLILLVTSSVAYAQTRTISGKVIDKDSKAPVIGATIIIKGTDNGAYSLEEGMFTIENVNGAATLEVSFMGYRPQNIDVAPNQTNVDIELSATAVKMDEIVVLAFGKQDKKSLTGSVAVVSTEEIASRPVTNVVSAIQGTAPGIRMTTPGGAPGSDPVIQIRGAGSINASTAPLYVVDGIPYSGDIATIPNEDIASISVLKDAASTALYGSRASNGVIMIQTKNGRKEKVQFNVKIREGISFRATPEYDKMGVEDFYETSWERYRNDLYFGSKKSLEYATNAANQNFLKELNYNIMRDKNTYDRIPNDKLVNGIVGADGNTQWLEPQINQNSEIMPGYVDDIDWLGTVAGIGFRQDYSMSASGGSDKANYYASLGYTDDDGYFEYTDFARINARMKANINVTKWMEFGANLSIAHTEYNNPYLGGNYYMNPWYFARYMAPIYPVNLHDQYTGEYINDLYGNHIPDIGNGYDDGVYSSLKRKQIPDRHVIYEGEHNTTNTKRLTSFAQAYLNIKFLKDFKFTVDFSVNNQNTKYKRQRNALVGDGAPAGEARNYAANSLDWNFKQLLNWERQFDDHNISAIVGHEAYKNTYDYLFLEKSTQVVDGITELANYSELKSGTGYITEYATEGFFGRVNYNYKEKYFVSGSYRRDGSSKFHPSHQWGNFWSIGASWIISSEQFMANATWLDMLKFRASYGSVGNDGGIGRYDYQALYFLSNLDGDPATYWSIDGSPDLGWETGNTLSVGFDFMMFGRLNGSIDYFDRSSDELIFNVPQAMSSGQTSVAQNIGAMWNRGIEFAFDVDVIRKNEWLWNIGMNATWYKNKITKLSPEQAETGIVNDSKKFAIGHSRYDFWLRKTNGIDPQDGSVLFYYGGDEAKFDPTKNRNHREIDGQKYTVNSSEAMYDWAGSSIPDLFGAISTSVTWRNLSLDVMFSYKIGGKSMDRTYLDLNGSKTAQAKHTDLLTNAWRKPGDIATMPRMQSNNSSLYAAYQDRNLIDGSYLALQNVTLTYNFPKKIVKKLHLSALSAFCSGENLFQISALKGYDGSSTFTGIQNNSNFGASAVITFGVNLSF